jgi:hypothetical protein
VKHDAGRLKQHIDTRKLCSSHKLSNNTIMPPDLQTGAAVAAQSVVAKDVDTRKF